MSYNKSPLAFDDIAEAFERALAAPKGIRIPCASRGAAINLRSRFNYLRKINRTENRTVYGPEHPMHGRSIYDKLILRIPPREAADCTTLYIEPRSIEDLRIEEIA
jgi:hypothetical protein